MRTPNPSLLRVLARAFLAGEPTAEQIVARGTRMLGRPWRWLGPVAQRYLHFTAGGTRPRHRDVVRFLQNDKGFARAWARHFDKLYVADWLTGPELMLPAPSAAAWDIPPLETPGDLADWLHVTPGELAWYADLKGLAHRGDRPRLSHYRYRVLEKRTGGIRLIEAPKPNLKAMQQKILEKILDRVPAHPSVHGFVKGRSIRTFAAPHVGQAVVLRMDLQDFFPSFAAARIQTVFRTLGYPEAVADLLGGLCTNAAPRGLATALYARPHLPQGAPTSPALANLCTYRLDRRLAGLARAAGVSYTRYADDLAFSGGDTLERHASRFGIHVAAILLEEGFQVNHRKTRIMRQGVRQHLAGLVVNRHLNVARDDYDVLKAILTNCIRLGPGGQNREGHPAFRAHLEGRVGFVETIHPVKGKRLRDLCARIQWPD